MDTFIDQMMGKMTLDEKIGQLNLSGGGVPGILSGSEGADETIRRGWLGATGGSELETFRKLQEIAVKESRLGIPLLFGLDVIHGYHTIFPIPLALSCSWDTTLRFPLRRGERINIGWGLEYPLLSCCLQTVFWPSVSPPAFQDMAEILRLEP